MNWASLIVVLIDAIRECIQNRDRDDVKRGLRDPGAREAWAIRRVLRKETHARGIGLITATRDALRCLHEMGPEEVEELMCEAEDSV